MQGTPNRENASLVFIKEVYCVVKAVNDTVQQTRKVQY